MLTWESELKFGEKLTSPSFPYLNVLTQKLLHKNWVEIREAQKYSEESSDKDKQEILMPLGLWE